MQAHAYTSHAVQISCRYPLALKDVRGMTAPAILAIMHRGHEDTGAALQPNSQH